MTDGVPQIAVLGATGSIGTSTLDVIRSSQGRLALAGISTHQRWDLAWQQAQEFAPRWLVVADPQRLPLPPPAGLPPETRLLHGPEGLVQLASAPDVDIVVAAIVGIAGLESTWAALQAGKRVALANKETMVVAGPLMRALADKVGSELLPVDSEHSAIFQALSAGRRSEVRRVVLTASGGPFRTYSQAELAEVTVKQALAHPVWDMGPKITIDSATMMNKALELIEARWLFGLEPDQIDIVVHPQSVVHSMVEFVDGSVLAQLSPPDMRLPIQYALTYPRRWPGPALKMDFSRALALEFEPPDGDRFPALQLGWHVARCGGTAGVVVNAANEAAVQAFLDGEIRFLDIVPACQAVLEHHHYSSSPTLEELMKLDRWARQEVTKWVCT